MKIAVTLHCADFRGDHEADIVVAHEVKPGETVHDLAVRLLGDCPKAWLTVRMVVEVKP